MHQAFHRSEVPGSKRVDRHGELAGMFVGAAIPTKP
jgi:hypothetical protein